MEFYFQKTLLDLNKAFWTSSVCQPKTVLLIFCGYCPQTQRQVESQPLRDSSQNRLAPRWRLTDPGEVSSSLSNKEIKKERKTIWNILLKGWIYGKWKCKFKTILSSWCLNDVLFPWNIRIFSVFFLLYQ